MSLAISEEYPPPTDDTDDCNFGNELVRISVCGVREYKNAKDNSPDVVNQHTLVTPEIVVGVDVVFVVGNIDMLEQPYE